MKYGFGVDLGGTTVKLAFFDQIGTLLHKWEIPTDISDEGSRILPDIANEIKGYIQKNAIAFNDLMGIGIGVPGPVTPDGVVNKCINLGWGVFNVEQALSQLTDLPVKAGNDATVATLGECWRGGGAGCKNMVMATLGTGVGGGIVADGRIVYGATGAGGEIGHMVLNRDEAETCSCGKKGCVEQYCSATGIVRIAKQFLAKQDTPSLLRRKENFTCKDVFDAAAAGDAPAREILEQVYAYMAEFLANICNVVNPQCVVLGGGVSKVGQPLLDGIERHFHKYIFHAAANVRFALATLGNNAGIYGAFYLIKENYNG